MGDTPSEPPAVALPADGLEAEVLRLRSSAAATARHAAAIEAEREAWEAELEDAARRAQESKAAAEQEVAAVRQTCRDLGDAIDRLRAEHELLRVRESEALARADRAEEARETMELRLRRIQRRSLRHHAGRLAHKSSVVRRLRSGG